jgi:hypothetical protein
VADSKISALTAVTVPAGTDEFAVNQGGTSKKMTLTQIAAASPGHEFDYVEFTSPVTVTSTTEAGADTVVTSAAIAYDGSTAVFVEFYCSDVDVTADYFVRLVLYDGASSIGIISADHISPFPTNDFRMSVLVKRRLTPSAATHTYSIRAFGNASTGSTVNAGAGGTGNYMPGFIRITKV